HVWLVFGMVRPVLHRRGIGAAMLLARLGALPRPTRSVRVNLSSIAASEGFFARFGFAHQGQMPLPASGGRLDVKSAILDTGAWEACRTLVSQLGIELASLPPVPTIGIWAVEPTSLPCKNRI